jgi:hypothetical protein
MDIDEMIARLDDAASRINREAEKQCIVVVNDIAQLVKNRVIQSGKTADNGTFSPYSSKQLPAYFYFDKSRTASAEKTVRNKAKTKQTLSYKDFREVNNLETKTKNFEFSGDMWRHFGVVAHRYENGIATVEIGGQTTEAAKKIAVSGWKENQSIIAISETEKAEAQLSLTLWVENILEESLRS